MTTTTTWAVGHATQTTSKSWLLPSKTYTLTAQAHVHTTSLHIPTTYVHVEICFFTFRARARTAIWNLVAITFFILFAEKNDGQGFDILGVYFFFSFFSLYTRLEDPGCASRRAYSIYLMAHFQGILYRLPSWKCHCPHKRHGDACTVHRSGNTKFKPNALYLLTVMCFICAVVTLHLPVAQVTSRMPTWEDLVSIDCQDG